MKIWNLKSSGKNKGTEKDTDIDKEINREINKDAVRKKLIFKGRVQFVGFRYQSKYFADQLGLTGFVQNLDNGDVLMEVQGTEEGIRELIRRLQGSKPIQINAIEEERLPVKREDGFRYYY